MDPFKVKELLALGGFSSLCADVAETKETAYHFSRGEELSINRFKDIEDYRANVYGEEYDYILCQRNGKAVWYVRHYGTQENWVPLEQAFIDEQDQIAQEEME